MHRRVRIPRAQCAYRVTRGSRGRRPARPGSADGRAPASQAAGLPPLSGHGAAAQEQGKRRPPGRVQESRGACRGTSPTGRRYCWDKSALRLAFIFSRRFTRWPLLTSSSSVLSRAERSWNEGERQLWGPGFAAHDRLVRLQSY